MNKKKGAYLVVTVGSLLLYPFILFAQTTGYQNPPPINGGARFDTLVFNALTILNYVAGVLVLIGMLFLAFGILKYLLSGGDATRRAEGAKLILWGVIGLAVMVSFWGFVTILLNSLFDQAPLGSFQMDERLLGGN